jgi:hypothetical protein
VNPETGVAELCYHIEFRSSDGREYVFEGRKYMQRSGGDAVRDILGDYTTLFSKVHQRKAGKLEPIGTAYLKFRTFEDIMAVGNLAGFLRSFNVTGTSDPGLRLQGQLRFMAFTAQFVAREYDRSARPRVYTGGHGPAMKSALADAAYNRGAARI